MKFPRNEELMEIAQYFNELGFLDGNITVVIEVDDKKMLNRINDDFYYRYKDKNMKKTEDITELRVNLSGIQFIYVPREEENESNK